MLKQLKENTDNNITFHFQNHKKSQKLKDQFVSYCVTQNINPTNETGFFYQSFEGLNESKQGQTKLLQLTSQCISYFNRFILEKDMHLQIIKKAFTDLKIKVQQAFDKIITQAQKKCQQICVFLKKEEQRLLQEKRNQQEILHKLLCEIQQVHLTKLLGQEECSQQLLTGYAQTLQSFFNAMMQVQKNCFEDNLEECVNFINNLVKEELKMIVEERYPKKVDDFIVNQATQENYFSFDHGIPSAQEQPDSLLDQIYKPSQNQAVNYLKIIRQQQLNRAKNIQQYQKMLSSNKGLKIIQ